MADWQAGESRSLTKTMVLHRMTDRIRHSLNLQTILDATATEIRLLLQVDRLMIYRFDADGSGEVIAEATNRDRLPSLLHLHFPATDIPPAARELFVKARQRVIVNVPAQETTVSYLSDDAAAGLTLEAVLNHPIQDIVQRPVDPCHVQYLTNMGVQASLVVPVFHRHHLWGLIAAHHARPKTFKAAKLEVLQFVADQVAIALEQSHLLQETQERANREALINKISLLLHAPTSIDHILQLVLEQIVRAAQGSGGRLYLSELQANQLAQLYCYGTQPECDPAHFLERTDVWQQRMTADPVLTVISPADWQIPTVGINHFLQAWMQEEKLLFSPWTVADLYQEPALEEVYPYFQTTPIRSVLIMPLWYAGQCLGCLTLFRNHVDTNILWAGKFDPDVRHQPVRQSFAVWQEMLTSQASAWTAHEVKLVQAIGTHLVMAIMQDRLYQCEREQRVLVEQRNQQLNLARAVAEEANRLKSDFLASTSHELRTPLASTLNYLKLLKEGFYDSPEELQQYIAIAHQSSENLVSIINDVLDIAKIEAGRMSVQPSWVNLPALFQEQQTLFKAESQLKGIPLVLDCAVDQVFADPMRLRQILTNLLANAFKFTAAGTIHLCAIPGTNTADIVVRDTGIGVDPAQCDLLFEPFVQADGSIKRQYGGTGLGLAICKRLIELMRGQIWLESAGLGHGTTVTCRLPTQEYDV